MYIKGDINKITKNLKKITDFKIQHNSLRRKNIFRPFPCFLKETHVM